MLKLKNLLPGLQDNITLVASKYCHHLMLALSTVINWGTYILITISLYLY